MKPVIKILLATLVTLLISACAVINNLFGALPPVYYHVNIPIQTVPHHQTNPKIRKVIK